MNSIYSEGNECPVCQGKAGELDLNCETNEQEFVCRRCGYYNEAEIVERAGKKFWHVVTECPMAQDGKVACPGEGINRWTRREFGFMPDYDGSVETFADETSCNLETER